MSNLPLPAGTWTIDPNHSSVQFKVRHLGLTNVRGRFNKLDSTLVVGDSLDDSSLNASIAINSIDTNQADRDGHLLGTDFFSAEKHPELTFASTAIKPNGDDEYTAEGDLTINGVTKPVALAVEFTGRAVHPADGKERAGFTATAEVLRDDFGIDFNMPLGADKLALGKKIGVEIDIQYVAPQAD